MFTDGQKVRISYWGHRWHDLPVGRGEIQSDDEKAWVDGKFFLDTQAGLETYKTVKNLAELQEWSYGFDIDESYSGQFEEQDVRFLKKMIVHEVSPVMLGAGIGTMTEAIKGQKTEDGGQKTEDGNGTASEDADQNEDRPGSPEPGTSQIPEKGTLGADAPLLESEAGAPGNESDVPRKEDFVSPETIQQLINLEMEIDDEY